MPEQKRANIVIIPYLCNTYNKLWLLFSKNRIPRPVAYSFSGGGRFWWTKNSPRYAKPVSHLTLPTVSQVARRSELMQDSYRDPVTSSF